MAGEPGGPGCPAGPCGPAGPMGPPLPGSPFIPCSTTKPGGTSQSSCGVLLLRAESGPQQPHLLAPLSWSARGSSISCGSRFSLWTHFTLHKKKKINLTNVKISKSFKRESFVFFLPLILIYCLTFCPSMPGKPMAPCGDSRAESRWDGVQGLRTA